MERKRRSVLKWILLSAIVLSHIVFVTPNTANTADAGDRQEAQSNTNDQTHEETVNPEDGQKSQKPPWTEEDSGGGGSGNTTDEATGKLNNFSEAFNVKHLIYFENSSQNEGIPSGPSPSHIFNLMEKSDNRNHLESQIASKLDTFQLNDTKGVKDAVNTPPPVASQLSSDLKPGISGGNQPHTQNLKPTDDSADPKVEEVAVDSEGLVPGEPIAQDEVFLTSMEPTPLADSDLVTEDPSQAQPVAEDAEEKVNSTASVEEHPMPVFSEWAKQMEKAEKKQEQDVANASLNKNKPADRQRVSAPKIRAKNYASPDCGAKIIAANQESDNVGHVLSSSKDEYLISICTSRIWFVVELCEPIQAEKVELANFELFSSSPKEFSVSVSNRYPTRDWSEVGHFEAKDERTIQNFELDPKLFGKFVRVDIHSHYNKEHFCPVSLFRVQGTSEFEAFETADQKQPLDDVDEDEFEEERLSADKDAGNNNLFKSASDVVLSMVKKAAQVLTKAEGEKQAPGMGESVKQVELNGSQCVSPRNEFKCSGCQESMTKAVDELLRCQGEDLDRMWRWQLVKDVVKKTELCGEIMGVDLKEVEAESGQVTVRDLKRDFVVRLLPEAYLIALCNVAAGEENRLQRMQGVREDPSGVTVDQQQQGRKEEVRKAQETIVNNLTMDEPGLMEVMPKEEVVFKPSGNEQKLIFDPRNTETRDCEREPVEEEKSDKGQEGKPEESVPISSPEPEEVPSQIDRPPEANPVEEGQPKQQQKTEEVTGQPKDIPTTNPNGGNAAEEQWKVNGDNGLEVQKGHGESVFLRLSNRIKALEKNMSLSSQYLEELSRRYKKQVEELQQSFAKTILSFEEASKQSVEEKQVLKEENDRLREDISEVLENFIAWKSILFYLVVFVCIQIVLFVLLLLLYIKNRLRERRREQRREEEEAQLRSVESNGRRMSVTAAGRRNSTEGISVSSRSTTSLSEGRKRPSEEALQIVGTYQELLIESPKETVTTPVSTVTGSKKKNKDKSRNRKTSLPNQVYQSSSAPQPERKKSGQMVKLSHSQSINGQHPEQVRNEPIVSPNDSGSIVLEENDEFYLPGSDLAYVEFVDQGQDTGDAAKKEKNSRRLSSPGFLRSALSRSIKGKGKKGKVRELQESSVAEDDVQSTTSNSSWDWYKLRRSSAASKSSSGQFVGNGSISLSSQDEVDADGNVEEVEETEAAEEEQAEEKEKEVASSPKKTTKFRSIFRKVF